jgi:hypothetical protein
MNVPADGPGVDGSHAARATTSLLFSSTLLAAALAGHGCLWPASPASDDCATYDGDRDGFPRPSNQFLCCDPDQLCTTDCNDEDPDVHPSGISDDTVVVDEPGDGIDKNCDGVDGVTGVDG